MWNTGGERQVSRTGGFPVTAVPASAAQRNSHISLLPAVTGYRLGQGAWWLLLVGRGGGEQAAFPSFPSRSLPVLGALQWDWGLGANQPGEHRAGWEAAGREGELLGQGREVKKEERQMGKQRECQGEGCSW